MNPKLLKTIILFVVLSVIRVNGFCAEEVLPSPEEIIQNEKRGRQIAFYERLTQKATDMLLEDSPEESRLEVYLARLKSRVWTVYFGKISDDRKSFEVARAYCCPEKSLHKMKAVEAVEVDEDVFERALAVKTALESIELEAKAAWYNSDVFREEDSTITVYLMPGNRDPDVIVLGGDFRISVSPDGSKVISKVPLHRAMLEMSANKKKNGPGGSFHTHVLNDMPTDTDIALVLLNPQIAPHLIIGRQWISQIDKDGKVTVLGETKEIFLK